MKKLMSSFAAMLLCLDTAAGCTLTMPAADGLVPFFEKHPANQQWQGKGVDWLEQISQQINCKPELIEVPWGRALSMLQKGQLDLMTNLSKTKDREAYLDFVGPHSIEKMVLLLQKTEQPIDQLQDISQLRGQIAVLSNGFYGEEFDTLYQGNPEFRRRIVLAPSSKAMKMMLATGRVSGLIEDEQVIKQWQQQHKLSSTDFYLPLTVNATAVYIGLSKKALSTAQREQIRNWWRRANYAQSELPDDAGKRHASDTPGA